MKQGLYFTKTILLICLVCIIHRLAAQDLQDTRIIGVLSFSANTWQDSVAARNIYAVVSRILIQTKRFSVIDFDKWKLTQDEIERQRDAGFLERDIISQGRSLGADGLIVAFVKNTETYKEGSNFAARVDFELKYVDVQTGKSIAAASFTGDSEKFNDLGMGGKISSLSFGNALLASGKRNWTRATLLSIAVDALSKSDIQDITGKTIDAIEESTGRVKAWVNRTFDLSLMFLQALDEDKKKGIQSVLIQGGDDVGMKRGYKLKMVLVTDIKTASGRIRDEEPIADLVVKEVRAQTALCTVVRGGKRIVEVSQNKNMRIVFD